MIAPATRPAGREHPEVRRPHELPEQAQHEQAARDHGDGEHHPQHRGKVRPRPGSSLSRTLPLPADGESTLARRPAEHNGLPQLSGSGQENASACASAQSANVRAGRPVTSATAGYTVASSSVPPT